MSVTLAYQGEPGAFSEEAALTWTGNSGRAVAKGSFREVAEAVVSGEVELGVLPVENTLAGVVAPAYDVLGALPLRVVGEVVRPIRMCLLAFPGSRLEEIRRVESHPVALAQCGRFLAGHPGIEAVAVHDTAGAARRVAEARDPSTAAIASAWAGQRYGLDVLAAGIQDRPDNRTRFFIVAPEGRDSREGGEGSGGPDGGNPEGPWKTALLVETPNRPGALVAVLAPFADRQINLTHLECRPGEDPWSYRFFLDVTTPDRESLETALREVEGVSSRFRVLGRFRGRE